ncbi:hypothetical protein [Nocardioides campestrisoli]|uniref:hypothetical protein n=1 Tax=Nocardioides campestrisoli TaxID=2736757 RepID=UPI0015E7CD45|nr:hypothetical protein [Nocardioides campestrisoli]
MNKTTRILLGTVTSLALVTPTVGLAGAAHASGESQTQAAQTQAAESKAKPKKKKNKSKKQKLAISAKKGYVHFGLTTDTVTVKAKGRKGKVTFAIDGVDAGTVKLKKRKATLTIPATLAIGEHVVTAKVKKHKTAKIKIVSHNTTMTLATTAVTVNRATYDAPNITGQLLYKGAVATTGWVDAYLDDGSLTIGSDSPDLLGVHSVKADGSFQLYTHDFLEFPPGTYTMKAFFEYDAGFDEYLFGTPITVTVI